MKKQFRSFKDARKFAHSLKLKGQNDWGEYCKSGKKPANIPSNPHVTYKNKGWIDWGDFLGTGNIALKNKKFLSWKDARKIVHSLNLKSTSEWAAFCHSGKRPDNIPYKPDDNYKNKGWISWGDWLGTGIIAPHLMEFRQFEDARDFVRKLKLQSQKEWREYIKSGNKPDDIPSAPNGTYKTKGWNGFPDWLGTDYIPNKEREYRSFEKARDFVSKLGLQTRTEWDNYCKSGNKPENIPSQPVVVYTGKGWKGIGDWLGTGTIANQNREYLSFEKAKEIIHDFKIKGKGDWQIFCKSGKKPNNIPSVPERVYKNKGWKGWGDWLGTGTISPIEKSKTYLLWPEAKKEYRRLHKEYGLNNYTDWIKFISKHKKLLEKLHLPSQPWFVYTRERVWRKMQE